MEQLRNSLTFLTFAIIISYGLNCGLSSTALVPVEGLKDMQQGETIVVGRFILIPALKPAEQVIMSDFEDIYKDKIMWGIYETEPPKNKVDFDSVYRGTNQEISYLPIDKTFFHKIGNKPFYIVGMELIQSAVFSGGRYSMSRMQFPARFKIDIQPGDKAVYIGTLIYHRDEFNGVTNIELKDDYQSASQEFQKKFGSSIKLKKSLLTVYK